jgi:pectinesterase
MKNYVRIFSVLVISTLTGFISAKAQDVYKITVAQDGTGDYKTIMQAIDAARSFPDQRITIFIKNGTYNEKVVVPAQNTKISMIGESVGKTIITFGDFFNKMNRGRNSTFYTYTMLVDADDFYAENITIINSAGPVGQAVALHVRGDRCVFRNCRILGNQDTLYTDGFYSRQYFDSCFIEGTTDFIFGASTALFSHCTINSKGNSYVTAASTPQSKPYGYVFLDCKLTAGEGVSKAYLGRPWRDFARVVFIRCNIGSHILPAGWQNWSGTNRDKTAYYAEYGNTGPGANTSRRAGWSHQLSKEEASEYTVNNILAPVAPVEKPAEEWIQNK